MKIQYASDLHLELADNSHFLNQNPLEVVAEVLVLAGDIGRIGDDSFSTHPFWNWASANYQQVIVAVGNHELYNLIDINDLHDGWMRRLRHNVTCCYNCVIPVENTDLVVSTLWPKVNSDESIPEFDHIRNEDKMLDAERMSEEHFKCIEFIERKVAKSNAKSVVVVSHYEPDLKEYNSHSRIDYWIYGHSHSNTREKIGSTICVSNSLGCVNLNEHSHFDPARTL